ncbi:hypothetical protein MSG28_000193 [Choristoneura fumiferana]|uniref:Uncharacterized protein n=1 Tax=Choristoneura fumiferana TaxID=7141 RepID=A0ACC0JZH1_CHOFU|nr:hypothetical protein MSG28_000193 [Choristoneura fumiferana]
MKCFMLIMALAIDIVSPDGTCVSTNSYISTNSQCFSSTVTNSYINNSQLDATTCTNSQYNGAHRNTLRLNQGSLEGVQIWETCDKPSAPNQSTIEKNHGTTTCSLVSISSAVHTTFNDYFTYCVKNAGVSQLVPVPS